VKIAIERRYSLDCKNEKKTLCLPMKKIKENKNKKCIT
jgi:hypothetical protein